MFHTAMASFPGQDHAPLGLSAHDQGARLSGWPKSHGQKFRVLSGEGLHNLFHGVPRGRAPRGHVGLKPLLCSKFEHNLRPRSSRACGLKRAART